MFQKISVVLLKWYLPGIIIGAAAGYTYYHFWGCDGSCMISSSPANSMLYGATMGGLLNSVFKPDVKKRNIEEKK
jgi:hypothetical protein